MLIVLDTQVLVWHVQGDRRLGSSARRFFDNALKNGDAAISTITYWEIAMLVEKNRIATRPDFVFRLRQYADEVGIIEIPVSAEIAIAAGTLSNMHGDPADRIIVATAIDQHQLLTADRHILNWPGELARIRATD